MTGDGIYIHMRDHMIEEASPFCPTCNNPLSLIAGGCSEYVNHIGTCLGGSATETDTTCNEAVDPINTEATYNDALDKGVDTREYQEAPLQLNHIVNPSWSCPICLHTQDEMPDWEMEVHVLTCVSDWSKGYCPTCNQDLYDLEAGADIINHLKECAVRRWDVVLSTLRHKDVPRIVLQPALDSHDVGFNTLPKICDHTLLHAVMNPEFLSYDRALKNASGWNNWWMTATIPAPEEVANDTPTALDENDDEDFTGGKPQNATSETILANHVDTITSNIPYSKMSKVTLLRGIRSVSEMVNKHNSTSESLPSSRTLRPTGSTGSAHTKNSTNTVYSKSMNFTCEDELYLEETERADDQVPLETTSELNANVTESDSKGHAKRHPINFACEDELSRAAQTTEKKADKDEDDDEVELIPHLEVEPRTITLKSGKAVELSSLSFVRVEGELLALLMGRDGSLVSLARKTPKQAALDKKTREKQAPTPPGGTPKTEAQKARKRRQRKNHRANKLAKKETV
ncbi:hypothetical protein BS50DRAFT_638943 [Corynespora cassiicola Philippines]|uniref:Uncharacterized protein n=1 Tax=Corynespora cassiicola Philippines TaxID=1448308 RepID=A0A2T2N853_CORCC|nr:hypothetical protein BS50DRAFT_638943 [Corynespora cassiicola Philippines]